MGNDGDKLKSSYSEMGLDEKKKIGGNGGVEACLRVAPSKIWDRVGIFV